MTPYIHKANHCFIKISIAFMILISIAIAMPNRLKAQNVTIPDANFKTWVLANVSHPSSSTNITKTEAAAYTGKINISALNITDLTGIESFTGMDSLDCSYNNMSSLNISTNTALVYLNCSYSGLLKLDVGKNTLLSYLNCGYTAIDSLNTRTNTQLAFLFCGYSNISSLDVTKNVALIYLGCNNSKINSLDVTKNRQLQYLFCGYSYIATLNVTNNQQLLYLGCNNSPLSALDVSNNKSLVFLSCNNSSISTLDLSLNTALNYLYCGNSNISSLNVSNNTALTYFGCNGSKISSLDVTNNTALNYLGCNNININSLDVSQNTALNYLYCGNTGISSLNVSKNTALTTLSCNYSFLSSLDISKNKYIDTLYCNHDSLISLNIKNGNNTLLAKLIATNNTILTCIEVDSVAYANSHWKTTVDTIAHFSTHCSLLPVTLMAFDVQKTAENKVTIQWSVANQINMKGYAIERSINGKDFSDIAWINPLENSSNHYTYTDNDALKGIRYYRLRMMNTDGTYTYSHVVKIELNSNSQSYIIYPNPVKNELNISINKSNTEMVTLSILSVTGSTLKQQQVKLSAGNNHIVMPVMDLPKGCYLFSIKGNTVGQQLFIKQ